MIRNVHPAWIAGGIALSITFWLALGPAPTPVEEANAETLDTKRVKVRVMASRAQSLQREEIVSAKTAPLRSVKIRAEVSGRVQEVLAERGQLVETGDLIIKLDPRDRASQLDKAQASLKQRQLQYQAALGLKKRGLQSPVDLATAKSNLRAAEADAVRLEQELAHTMVRAPFSGVLERRPVELGQFVNVGDDLGHIIQQSPYLVRGQVSEDVIAYLSAGQSASARLSDGREVQGKLHYVASQAHEGSRGFAVELLIQSAESRLISGASAVLVLPLETVKVHVLEPASLALDENGNFGIKSVDEENRVHFHQAELVQSREKMVWLAGLADELNIITVGQGFAGLGDVVDTLSDKAAGAAR